MVPLKSCNELLAQHYVTRMADFSHRRNRLKNLHLREIMKITVGSDLHKCFHEAGHIETAYLYGATVASAYIDADGNGRTAVRHKPDLSTKSPVACGGFAVELILFEGSWLVDGSGHPLSSTQFVLQAMNNARVDKRPYYLKHPMDESGIYPGSLFQPYPDGTWSLDSDGPFIDYATQNIVPKLRPRLQTIEVLANELYLHGPLTQDDIEAIRTDMRA